MSDLISRQDAIDAIVNTPSEVQNKNIPLVNQYDGAAFRQIEILGILEALPTAEPEWKGRWVLWNGPWSEYVKCTACGEIYNQDDLYIGGNDYPKFCPNCGADMRGE